MNKFVASLHGEQIATLNDHPDASYTIAGMVADWIRQGWAIVYQCEQAPATVDPPTHGPKVRRVKRHERSAPPQLPEPQAGSGHVYLRWSALSDEQRLTLSSYRTTPGMIVERRHAVGTCVRFDNNAELVWLPGKCLTRVPEFD